MTKCDGFENRNPHKAFFFFIVFTSFRSLQFFRHSTFDPIKAKMTLNIRFGSTLYVRNSEIIRLVTNSFMKFWTVCFFLLHFGSNRFLSLTHLNKDQNLINKMSIEKKDEVQKRQTLMKEKAERNEKLTNSEEIRYKMK